MRVLEQVEFVAARGGLRARGHAQLAEDVGHMRFDRPLGNDQLLGNLPVARSGDNQVQHFRFARRERFRWSRGSAVGAAAQRDPESRSSVRAVPSRCSAPVLDRSSGRR